MAATGMTTSGTVSGNFLLPKQVVELSTTEVSITAVGIAQASLYLCLGMDLFMCFHFGFCI